MKPPVIGRKVNDEAIDALIDSLEAIADPDDVFYIGYPVAATIDEPVTVPALLVSPRIGLVCFDVVPNATIGALQNYKDAQRRIVVAMKSKLLQHEPLVEVDGFDLAFRVNIVTYAIAADEDPSLSRAKIVSDRGLREALESCSGFSVELLPFINAAIERVANIRPRSRRGNLRHDNSKGAILKKIEKQIANLDSWQKAAAIETPNGPQRIRGLAGTGKTIVLALKAAYLHGEHPNWKIGVTFHTRALKQQFDALIRRFYFEDYRQDPDKEFLKIVNSFGSMGEPGVYSMVCNAYGIPPRDFGYAKRTYGYNGAFAGICAELLKEVEKAPKPVFDALLIDEAQDLPKEFLRIAYLCTREHRIVWAYDDLQNLGDYQMRSLKETFGEDQNGNSLVSLPNVPKQPRRDIILPKCYRNPPWTLVAAHALGSGTYRGTTLVQHPDDPALWKDIGYEIVDGDLALGNQVVLKRSDESSPQFFFDLLSPDEVISFHRYDDDRAQFAAVADMIADDIGQGELFPHDIAVVFPDAISAEKRGLRFRQFLSDRGIESHMVGVTSSRDGFLIEGMVAVTGPYRAKGNEAPMIYVMDADFCASGAELIKKRNILFTAITRSRAWVRVCGVGEMMDSLVAEFDVLKGKDYKLDFRVPTEEELKKMRTLYRDVTSEDRRIAEEVKKAFEKLPRDSVDAHAVLQTLPKELRERLLESLSDIED